MNVLSVKHLSHSFDNVPVLKDVSFSLNEGERAAVVGANGAGKSTLLKLIFGEYTPEEGQIHRAAGISVGMLSQHALEGSTKSVLQEALSTHENLQATEQALASLSKRIAAGDEQALNSYHRLNEAFEQAGGLTYVSRTKSALCAVGFSDKFDQSVSTLSGGQKTTLALVKLLLNPPDLLLLDEPTNHLDLSALGWLEDTVRSLRATVLCVSHDRRFLDRAFPKTLDLDAGHLEVYDLPYSGYKEEKKHRRAVAEKHYALQQKEIRRQEAVIQKFKQFNREKSIRAAESRQKALDRIERLDAPQREAQTYTFSFPALPSPHDVLRCEHLHFSYGQTPIVRDFSTEVIKGERVFLCGDVGSGKSTLLKLLCGALSPTSGRVVRGVGVYDGYYDQENQNLNFAATVFDELWAEEAEESQGALRSYLAAFGFKGEKAFQSVASLSGGERARLALSKLMRRKHNLIFLDEPTNHLDMDSKEALEEALLAYPGTCIIVSHDRYFIRKLATRLFYVERGANISFVPGGADALEDFCRARAEGGAPDKSIDAPSSQKEEYLRRKQAQADARRRQNLKQQTEKAIEQTESALEQLETLIAEDALDYVKLQAHYEEKLAKETELEALYETLFSLEETPS